MSRIAIGAIRKSHGVKGFVKIQSFSGEMEHFSKLQEIELRKKDKSRHVQIEEFRWLGKEIILKFQGIDSPEAAKKYNTWEIWVDKEYASPLREGEYYLADLTGSQVFYEQKLVGTVKGLIEGGAGELLEVVLEESKEVRLIPLKDPFIGEMDLKDKHIELLEDWFLQ